MAILANPRSSETPAHRLVIVEGIMGPGKSTTMRFVAKNLKDSGLLALRLHERTEPHPVRATDELEHWFEPWQDTTPQHLADGALVKWADFVEATICLTSYRWLSSRLRIPKKTGEATRARF